MVEKIKIYVRSKNKIYIQINDEILFFENQEIDDVIENIKDEFDIEDDVEIDIIVHFGFIDFIDNNQNNLKYLDKLQNKLKYKEEKIYFNMLENTYINCYFDRKEIEKYKIKIKKMKYKLKSIKIDFLGLYNKYKENDIEILQIGENDSIRLKIENGKIEEFEKIDLNLYDVEDIKNFDFGDMKVFTETEEEVKEIFLGDEMYENPNFLSKKEFKLSKDLLKIDWKLKDSIFTTLIIMGIVGTLNIFSFKQFERENDEIQKIIKEKEKKYIKTKEEKLPEYSKEIELLSQITEQVIRKEYYSFIKFLIESSKDGISYTKILYENKQWTIQGEIEDFKKFEIFEKKLKSKFKNIELSYIKDRDEVTNFEYKINIE